VFELKRTPPPRAPDKCEYVFHQQIARDKWIPCLFADDMVPNSAGEDVRFSLREQLA
jgi:hypothetical protein